MQNSVEIFSIALGLVEPWYVKEVVFDKERLQLDVYLGFKKDHLFLTDDNQHYTAYDTVERLWEHLNFFQHKCYLHAKVPRVKQSDGRITKIRTQRKRFIKRSYTFLKSKSTPEIKSEKDFLIELYPKLGQGYQFPEMFKDFWDIKENDEAETYLAFWCDYADDLGILPFKKASKTIKEHWSGIINYIESRINNGVIEGINSKIQLAKKKEQEVIETQLILSI